MLRYKWFGEVRKKINNMTYKMSGHALPGIKQDLTKKPVGPVAGKINKNINSEKSDVPHHSIVPTFSDFIKDAQNKKKSKK